MKAIWGCRNRAESRSFASSRKKTACLRKALADLMLDNEMLQEVDRRKL
jgi:hypothetical protein